MLQSLCLLAVSAWAPDYGKKWTPPLTVCQEQGVDSLLLPPSASLTASLYPSSLRGSWLSVCLSLRRSWCTYDCTSVVSYRHLLNASI